LRYIIYGAGAIGGVIGGKMHMNGKDVILIARGEHLRSIRRDGLTLKQPDESYNLRIPTAGNPSEIEWRRDDVVLLTMKSQDTQAALDDLRLAAGDGVPVVSCQNGVENERLALRSFRDVYGVVIFIPGSHIDPGVVETTAWPTTGVLDIGRYPRGVDDRARAIASDLDSSGFASYAVENVMAWKYTKLHGNVLNAVQAVCGEAEARDLGRQLRAETEAVFSAAGIEWVPPEELSERTKLTSRSTNNSGRQGNSTWQSLVRGQGTSEVDHLNGEIALLGRLHGVPTPANEVFQLVANQLARERKQPGSVTPDEMRAKIAEQEVALATSNK
jgi:2-dehydropantoate 2-reductase